MSADQFYHQIVFTDVEEKMSLLDLLSEGYLQPEKGIVSSTKNGEGGADIDYCFVVFESTFQFIEKSYVKLKFDKVKVKHKRLISCYEISEKSHRFDVIIISEDCSRRGVAFPILAEFKKAYVIPFQNFGLGKQNIYFIVKNAWEKKFINSLVLIDIISKDLEAIPIDHKLIQAVSIPVTSVTLPLKLPQSTASFLQDYQVLRVMVTAPTANNAIISPFPILLIAETDSMAMSTSNSTSIHSVYHQLKSCLGHPPSLFTEQQDELLLRVIGALLRDRRQSRSISCSSTTLMEAMSEAKLEPSPPSSILVDNYCLPLDSGGASRSADHQTVKCRPDLGWTVFEFFSGIGGMRLALPSTTIRDLPVHKICAYDISNVANQVYQHNFLSDGGRGTDELRRVAIDGLKLEEVDGRSDIWTMSPPCQPFTRTRGAHQRDHLDHRSKAVLHLMQLLLHMKKLPRFILLENVGGFVSSTIHTLWKRVMKRCRYRYREFLLSPHMAVGLPNSRKRYYFIAEHVDSLGPQSTTNTTTASTTTPTSSSSSSSSSSTTTSTVTTTTTSTTLEDGNDTILEKLPARLAATYPNEPCTIMKCVYDRIGHTYHGDKARDVSSLRGNSSEFFNGSISKEELSQLVVGEKVLLASWAPVMLSIVGPHDRASFCFTKGYGKIFDRSAGSLFFPQAEGPLSLEEFQIIDRRLDYNKHQQDDTKKTNGDYDNDNEEDDDDDGGSDGYDHMVTATSLAASCEEKCASMDRKTSVSEKQEISAAASRLSAVLGRVRLFSPEEMLALSGFPHDFAFPPGMPLRQRFQCVGNSVNVRVVQAVMKCLFEEE